MPPKKWTACERGKCRAHRIVCFHCKRIASKFCERHVVAGVTKLIGGKRYCGHGPLCARDVKRVEEYHRTHLEGAMVEGEYDKRCFLYAPCEACGGDGIVGICAGQGDWGMHGQACPTCEISTLCAKCIAWTRGLDGYFRCGACFPVYTLAIRCWSCKIMTEERFTCSACEKKACKACDDPIEIDVSPRNISGGAAAPDIKMSKTLCDGCFGKTSVATVQLLARAEQMERGLY